MKFVRKLLLGMAVFVILILIEVQATDINSTTFHHSLILIPLHHSSKLDRVNHHSHDCIKGPLSTCPKKKKNTGNNSDRVLYVFLIIVSTNS